MKRLALALVSVAAGMLVAAGGALGQSNGGGNSGNAPGQERAAAQCENVWGNIQADLVAGGGPKSEPVESIGGTTGPTNCDHFWQSEGIIGNG